MILAWWGPRSQRHEVPVPIDDDVVALLEPGVELEGKLKVSSGLVRINTQLKGEIKGDGTIVVADHGNVEAVIETKIISVAGRVKGTVRASERVEIKEKGAVIGDIHTPCLVVDPGGHIDGQCHMPVPEAEVSTPPASPPKEHW